MKPYYKHILAVFLVTALAGSLKVGAQSLKFNQAKLYEEVFNYEKSAAIYEDILRKKPEDYNALKGAALSYSKLQNTPKSEEKLLLLDSLKLAKAEDLLLLADAQKANRRYAQALSTYQKYSLMYPGNKLVQKYINQNQWDEKITRDSVLFDITNVKINSEFSDFSPSYYESAFLFSSSRAAKGVNRTYNWNQQSYLNIYSAEMTLDSNMIKPKSLETGVNSRYHEGAAVYHKESRTVYLTRNNYLKGSKKLGNEGYLNLAIYSTRDFNGEWEDLTPFPFNDQNYSVGHPSLTKDGKTIYFTSDMPGGFGGTDIYFSEWIDGEWSKPKNLGERVNTTSDELFPSITEGGVLYFSSKGHVGLGGLDILNINLNNSSSEVQNAGYPINSAFDDFSIIFGKGGTSGFFASNRPGGVGDDDIYKFFIATPKFITISGIITDEETNYPVKEATVFLKNGAGSSKLEIIATTDENGEYSVKLPYQKEYQLEAAKKGFFESGKTFVSSPTTSFIDNADIALSKYDFLAKGYVVYSEDNSPVEGARITLYDETGAVILQKKTKSDGFYSFGLYNNNQYKITCELADYALQSTTCDTRNAQSKVFEHDFKMFKLEVGVVVQLDNIYYDYGKANIRHDAALELDKLVSILEENPSMKIELSSHTDSRGSAPYNLNLSKRRAKSAVEYILSKGISSGRIKSRGYGETKPLNKCRDGVQCTEEEYQLNRRTEFTILDI